MKEIHNFLTRVSFTLPLNSLCSVSPSVSFLSHFIEFPSSVLFFFIKKKKLPPKITFNCPEKCILLYIKILIPLTFSLASLRPFNHICGLDNFVFYQGLFSLISPFFFF